MARFARRAESEPLMRLERPSSASAQTTAHVINACFNELLRQSPLESRDIDKLSVSKRGEHAYHDNFVNELKKVFDSNKCAPCLSVDFLARARKHPNTHTHIHTHTHTHTYTHACTNNTHTHTDK